MIGVPKRNRKTERREATRREILEAAWAVAATAGIGGLTLKEVALRVGMQPPSLYTHFTSKTAIYDAMFEDAWSSYARRVEEALPGLPAAPRARLLAVGEHFFDYATEDVARHQLMNERVIPGFEPSPRAYAPALAVIAALRETLSSTGIDDPVAEDLFTALTSGLVNQQMANDPGGDRWRRLLPTVMQMYADHYDLPPDIEETS